MLESYLFSFWVFPSHFAFLLLGVYSEISSSKLLKGPNKKLTECNVKSVYLFSSLVWCACVLVVEVGIIPAQRFCKCRMSKSRFCFIISWNLDQNKIFYRVNDNLLFDINHILLMFHWREWTTLTYSYNYSTFHCNH